MNMKKLSPSFQAVMDIARHAGAGMTVTRSVTIPDTGTTGSCQVWEFTPTLPPLDRSPVVVAVFLQDRNIRSWQAVSLPYLQAIDHYQAMGPRANAPPAAPPAPSPRVIASPPPPCGVRVTLPAIAGGTVFTWSPPPQRSAP
jgi:hypothetical protein